MNSRTAENIQEWIDELNERYGGEHHRFSVEHNKTYSRIISTNYEQRSAYAFVDQNGDIWKAAGWKAPAKNFTRGNVITNRQYPQYGF